MMRLPQINSDTAIKQWNAHDAGKGSISLNGQINYIGDEELPLLSDIELEGLIEELDAIRQNYDEKYPDGLPKNAGGRFDAEIVEPIHKHLSLLATPDKLCQIGFWRWLSNVASNGYFWDLIAWRFEQRTQVNWAITSPRKLKETLFFRCWLRGHRMLDPKRDDPYEYAKKGDSEFWRSHILRSDLGKDRVFVEAFLDFNFAPDGTRNISNKKLRTNLIPGLRAWASMGTFSHLSYEECTDIITMIWDAENG
jgi:hypothetical protein